MPQNNQDEIDRKREKALTATHPRAHDPNYRSRMVMLEEEPRSLFERGTHLDEFIDPDEPSSVERRSLRRTYRYGKG